jgi:transposase
MRAVRALQWGFRQTEVAAMLGTTNASVSKWAMRFRLGGFDELRSRHPGRPTRSKGPLSGMESVRRSVLAGYPDEVGIPGPLWTWRSVQALAFRLCQSEMSRWTVARYLKEWGLRPPAFLLTLAASRSQDRTQERDRDRSQEVAAGSPYFVGSAEVPGGDEPRSFGHWRRAVIWAVGQRGETSFAVYVLPLRPIHIIDFLQRLRQGCNAPILTVVADPQCSAPAIINWMRRQDRSIRLRPASFELTADPGGAD